MILMQEQRNRVISEVANDEPDMKLLYTTPESIRNPRLRAALQVSFEEGLGCLSPLLFGHPPCHSHHCVPSCRFHLQHLQVQQLACTLCVCSLAELEIKKCLVAVHVAAGGTPGWHIDVL